MSNAARNVLSIEHARRVASMAIVTPSPESLAASLPEIGDCLAAALAALARDPRPDGCETLAARLNGVARHVMTLRSVLLAQSQPTPPSAA